MDEIPEKIYSLILVSGFRQPWKGQPKAWKHNPKLGDKKKPKNHNPETQNPRNFDRKFFQNQVQKNLVMPFLDNWSRTASVDLNHSRLVKVI